MFSCSLLNLSLSSVTLLTKTIKKLFFFYCFSTFSVIYQLSLNCRAYHGGGCLLLQDEAKLIMADTVINNNNASSEGGAVKLLGTTSLNLNR